MNVDKTKSMRVSTKNTKPVTVEIHAIQGGDNLICDSFYYLDSLIAKLIVKQMQIFRNVLSKPYIPINMS